MSQTLALGFVPAQLTVNLGGGNFIQSCRRSDGEPFDDGTAIVLYVGNDETGWPADIDGAAFSWNVAQATVDAVPREPGKRTPVRLVYTAPGAGPMLWAEGAVIWRG